MTNSEKYLKDGVSTDEFLNNIIRFTTDNIGKCKGKSGIEVTKMFLETYVKPVLTDDEKVILKRINKDFEAIRRGVNSKVLQLWSDDTGYIGMDIFDEELFSWIQPRRRI